MFERSSLKWPIALGVTMIVLLVAIIIGWVLLSVGVANWTLLAVGSIFLVLVLVGVVMYLTLTVKSVNLTRRQSNFIDSVTHELKSPIASIKLYLQTLNRRSVSDEQRQGFYQIMLDDVERLDQLINHLLDAGRLDKSPQEEELEDVRLDVLLQECATAVRLRYQVAEDVFSLCLVPCIVRARRVDLDMIFRNLIDNAVKYAGDDPQVGIAVEVTSEDRVVAKVSDNGRGIPLPSRRKIFRRFVRLGVELERDKPGTGLGLYIVRTLVRRLRGRIRILDSENGIGTVFEVSLPRSPIDVEDQSAKNEDHPQQDEAA